jgi:hypothetical protein
VLVVRIVLLLGTALAAALLWRAGRRSARAAGGGRARRVVWGASVAPVYAALVWGLSQVAVLRFPGASIAEVRPAAVEALLGALALGAVFGGAGGAAEGLAAAPPSSERGGRAIAWVAGGWRMTVALVVLAFAAFLVVAGLRADVSAAYVRGVTRAGGPGAIAAAHHVLLLANQSLLIAAPSMGGCVTVDGSGSQPSTLCLRTLTVRPGWGTTLAPDASGRTVAVAPGWLLLLLVPLAATVWGGRAAAVGARSRRERAVRGAGAGVCFAALVTLGQAASTIAVERPPDGDVLRLGVDLAGAAALAAAWGVVGGTAGALLPDPRQGPAGAASPEDPDPEPPSPTSL